MPDLSHMLVAIGMALGVFGGLLVAALLAVLGHGWMSLLVVPVLLLFFALICVIIERWFA